jgi:hypothetical protein
MRRTKIANNLREHAQISTSMEVTLGQVRSPHGRQ